MKQGTKFLKTFILIVLGSAIFFGLHSCKKNDTYALDFLYGYAPTDTGHYVIYDVDSISYSNNGIQINDTAHYQLKEIITDTFYDGANEPAFELELYRSNDSGATWIFDRKWWMKKSTTTYQKIEDDVKFIKLVFPPETNKEWNGNLYVSKDEPFEDFLDWTYRYETVNVPYTINGLNFDSTASVLAVDDANAITKRLRREVYALGVGMVYQEWEILHAPTGVVFPDWNTGNIVGFRIRMRAIAHN
ncbi:MAG: hypothetical protein V4615_00140 [Bacteroidota bacterium]